MVLTDKLPTETESTQSNAELKLYKQHGCRYNYQYFLTMRHHQSKKKKNQQHCQKVLKQHSTKYHGLYVQTRRSVKFERFSSSHPPTRTGDAKGDEIKSMTDA